MNELTDETGSKAGKRMVLSPKDETNSSDPRVGYDGAIGIVVSPPETRKSRDNELDVYGNNAEKMTLIDDGSKEAECCLHEDVAIAEEKASSDEKEDDDGLMVEKRLAVDEQASKEDNNESSPCQNLAVGDGTQGQN
ncbi:unnamed protein product, partial [Microthlaspi erraticum]